MQLFYQNGALVTLASSARGNVRLLGHDRQCLAIHRSMASHSELTAVDKMNTPTLQIVGQERSALAATVYGFIAACEDLPSGFNGECLDPVSGLYGLGRGSRWYSPVLRRFLSPDNFSPFGTGGFNCYMFCAGDPVNRFDIDGHVGVSFRWWKNLTPIKVDGNANGLYSGPAAYPTYKKTLNIYGAGEVGDIEIGGVVYDASELVSHANSLGIKMEDFREIAVVSSFSGTSPSASIPSLAQSLAYQTGLPVIGFDGRILSGVVAGSADGLYTIKVPLGRHVAFASLMQDDPGSYTFFADIFFPWAAPVKTRSNIRKG